MDLNRFGNRKCLYLATGLFLFLAVPLFCAASEAADEVAGYWFTDDKSCIFHVYKEADGYVGDICWLKEPGDKDGNPYADEHNPSPELRSKPLVGLRLLKGFRHAGGKLWEDGTIYNPEDGRTYSALLRLKDDGKLEVRGYILGLTFLGGSTFWSRTGKPVLSIDN